MKLIIAIIQPNKLEEVKDALNKEGISRLTILDVEGYGKQKGHTEIFRGREYEIMFTRKVQLEIAVRNDKEKEVVVETILKNARTGNIGDGKIFVLPIEEVYRVRTGEKGDDAI